MVKKKLSMTMTWLIRTHPQGMWCAVLWCDVMWCDVMRCDVMWCDVMWCDVIRSCSNIAKLISSRIEGQTSPGPKVPNKAKDPKSPSFTIVESTAPPSSTAGNAYTNSVDVDAGSDNIPARSKSKRKSRGGTKEDAQSRSAKSKSKKPKKRRRWLILRRWEWEYEVQEET